MELSVDGAPSPEGERSIVSFFKHGRIGLLVFQVLRTRYAIVDGNGKLSVLELENGSLTTVADVGEQSTLWPQNLQPLEPADPQPDRVFDVKIEIPEEYREMDPMSPRWVIYWRVDPTLHGWVSRNAPSDFWRTRSAWPFVEVTNGGGTVSVNGSEYGAGYVKGTDFTVRLAKLTSGSTKVTYDVTAAF